MTERPQADVQLAHLAGEHAGLRRVATLVAREAPQPAVFTAIAEEIRHVLGSDEIMMERFEGDRNTVVVGAWGQVKERFPVGTRLHLDGDGATSRVFRTRQPARIEIAEWARLIGIRSAVATPILVKGRPWGALMAGTTHDEPAPPDIESHLARFTELMAIAIANAEAHAEIERLAEEHAALRRVATLVAKEAPPAEIFAKVAEEAAKLLGDVDCALVRDEGHGNAQVVGSWGTGISVLFPVGARLPLDGDGVTEFVLREGRPRRIDDYAALSGTAAEGAKERGIGSAVGSPIVVRGGIWGAIVVAMFDAGPCPPETESRIAQFADLVATAIANAEARTEVARLAEEQAALRRVATLVAQGSAPSAVLDAVAGEMERLLRADGVTLSRYERGEEVTVVAHRGSDPRKVPPGTRVSHQGENVTSLVRRTERAARMEHQEATGGAFARHVRNGVRASVGAPIVVAGRLWGVAIANWRGGVSPPSETEERMAQFAQLLDTAIANADTRDQLTASRARLLTASDEARRRVVRDLHDGAQQRLVGSILMLKSAQQAMREGDEDADSLVAKALEHAEQAHAELRELAHGILPSVLTRGGLRAAVRSFVERFDLPVDVDVPAERFPEQIEASAYFIVAEALTNVVKHSHADRAYVKASVDDGTLHVQVRDDGVGGADAGGHGLVGIDDRTTALGGRLTIQSPPGSGTLVAATLPLSVSRTDQ